MNNNFKKINVEKCLFLDIETASRNKELDLNSKEFELFQKKNRNRDTGDLLPDLDVQKLYKKEAGLRMGYNRIVTISIGYVKNNEMRIKALVGTEEEILREFCKLSNHFEYLVGFNSNAFDLSMIALNASRYFDITQHLKDAHITSGKKTWNLDKCLDIMELVKGAHYMNLSFDEACFIFGVTSPKEGLVEGSGVSEEYWTNGVDEIAKYAKRDIVALIQLFFKMRWEDCPTKIVDTDLIEVEAPKDERTLLQRIYEDRCIGESAKEEIKALCAKKKLTKKDKENLEVILYNTLIHNNFISGDQDNKATKEDKLNQVKELLNEI